jgi:phosphoribosyl 1,2-cyclic phosphate phosphodiesterase
MKITLLGTGTSMGVPMVGCACPVCHSPDSRNKRLRPSAWFQVGDRSVLIDAGIDFRLQALRFGIRRLDGILLTHSHADHILGLDDIRPFNQFQKQSIPCYGRRDCLEEIQITFRYAFPKNHTHDLPHMQLVPVEGPFPLFGNEVVPVPVFHGSLSIFGYRLGPVAYLTDVSRIPEESFAHLAGLSVLILGALRRKPHPKHFTLEEAVCAAQRIGAKRTYFTHMCHHLDHEETNASLPPGIQLAYDGLSFEV